MWNSSLRSSVFFHLNLNECIGCDVIVSAEIVFYLLSSRGRVLIAIPHILMLCLRKSQCTQGSVNNSRGHTFWRQDIDPFTSGYTHCPLWFCLIFVFNFFHINGSKSAQSPWTYLVLENSGKLRFYLFNYYYRFYYYSSHNYVYNFNN